ncbi:hypothetical protein, partial [uncultured Lamprocystis sp.]|uniref:hypothetical protein n=1 Tax=uncultured Lamprocystis sp. TaxID=543132 RepID=UPI0025CC437F
AAMDTAVTPNSRVTRPAPSRRDAAPTGDFHLPGWLDVLSMVVTVKVRSQAILAWGRRGRNSQGWKP